MSLTFLQKKKIIDHNFRPEIQGIRLLGALLVACFHIWGSGISGGVDVFFVISGYFLGFSQLRREKTGKPFNPIDHISLFINRTIPEVIAVLIFCLLMTILLLSPAGWKENLTHILFSALYLENLWLIFNSTDYLARNEDISLVQHFWAISIIAQVYVSWIIIIGLAKLGSKISKKNQTDCIISLLSFFALASISWSIWFTLHNPESAYFDPASRYWQFALGAITALLSNKISKSNNLLSAIGFILIISCGFIIGSTFNFPGIAALWPVSGAILVLLFSQNTKSILTTILSHPLVVKAGGLGFGVYLWHWPLYIIYLKLMNSQPNFIAGFMIILLSFVLAWFSSKLTTKNPANIRKRSLILILGLLAIATTSFGTFKIITKYPIVANKLLNQVYTSNIVPGPLDVPSSLPESYTMGCHVSGQDPNIQTCVFNENGKKGSVYLVGGSHAAHWLPALQELMIKNDFKLYTSTKSSCTFADPEEKFINDIGFNQSCIEWNKQAMKNILEISPDVVIAIGTRVIEKNNTFVELIPTAYLNNFKTLKAQNIEVLAIRDNPHMTVNIPTCVHKRNYQESDCQSPKENRLDDQNFTAQKSQVENWLYIADPIHHFCDQTICYAVKDNIMMYRDAHHLTVEYAKTLAPWMSQQLDALNLK